MTIDSNIVIAYLAGEESVARQLSLWKEEGRPLFLSTIAEAEVLGFPDFTSEERERTARFMAEQFVSMICDRTIAYQAGVLRGTINIKLPDALIAATALSTGTPLVTRNVKDFKNVSGLEVVSL
ncbi:MAG: type II toxin-antitoxin system VapC family toxin [bacterium]|nr:type II toxin-antitoxin system VapC family toxin [bacterium]